MKSHTPSNPGAGERFETRSPNEQKSTFMERSPEATLNSESYQFPF
jgi:hypothetical protein